MKKVGSIYCFVVLALACAGCATSPVEDYGSAGLAMSGAGSSAAASSHSPPDTTHNVDDYSSDPGRKHGQSSTGPYATHRADERTRDSAPYGAQDSTTRMFLSDDEALSLSQAWYAYKHFSYAEVMAWGNEVLRTTSANRQQQAEAAILMGASAYMLERNTEADGWFKRAVTLDPETKPNPALFTEEVRKRYEEARQSVEWWNR